MKVLAVDTSSAVMSISAENDGLFCTLCINAGMRQSEKLVPAIEYVLGEVGITPAELELCAVSEGPGSFTGLRLGYSAVKALSLYSGCPVYAVPTLSAWAYSYRQWPGAVIPAIDAKKKRFYASVFRQGEAVTDSLDIEPSGLLAYIDIEEPVLLTGPDAELLREELLLEEPRLRLSVFEKKQEPVSSYLLEEAKLRFEQRDRYQPIADYDGPLYIRKSEAEEAVSGK
ncbi:MAG: tRNA (adenosine(37)-N6)-threonylcarbamoyltransferase complex dimerization subunit type 1 TsaB [Spirochaetaceae bacterium]|jgi:tRNA threonylcarbamoyladenosine biosynthesis protein TsaB|nr:tRNA (adenosine(37)-N6)-threonylcarbamoyltransferase complex dimerization subunit type 1 TsaB [Spirochaetaceae bacterium]